MMFIILSGGLLVWNWRRRGPARNNLAYAGLALALIGLTPVEQLIGSRLSDDAAFRLSLWSHYGRYATSVAAVLMTMTGLVQMYLKARRRPIGGQLAGLIGLVLGGLTGLFTYTQQMWKVAERPILRELPSAPALRGGFVVAQPKFNFGFVAPSREWAQERETVRAPDAVVELTQRNLRGHTRVFIEPGVTALMTLRDHCVAGIKQRHPNLVVEKEETKTIHQFQAMRIMARATTDLGEQRFYCTVYSGTEAGYRMESWGGATAITKLVPDFEVMHDTFQVLQAKPK
ncbi:MAG: hypothetical protein HZA91_09890 [Verrucomicrobia bacterium]|nr:hypothetical protein [Verrucomicrobiota bacterium]